MQDLQSMKFLFLKTEKIKELIKTKCYENDTFDMDYKITTTIKFFNFVIYSNSKFTKF